VPHLKFTLLAYCCLIGDDTTVGENNNIIRLFSLRFGCYLFAQPNSQASKMSGPSIFVCVRLFGHQ
jgi:hypothetical protein